MALDVEVASSVSSILARALTNVVSPELVG